MNIKTQNILISLIFSGLLAGLFLTTYPVASSQTTICTSETECTTCQSPPLGMNPQVKSLVALCGFCILSVFIYLVLYVYRNNPGRIL
jgi:hypothetical protein